VAHASSVLPAASCGRLFLFPPAFSRTSLAKKILNHKSSLPRFAVPCQLGLRRFFQCSLALAPRSKPIRVSSDRRDKERRHSCRRAEENPWSGATGPTMNDSQHAPHECGAS
jgi:hypothetical protein